MFMHAELVGREGGEMDWGARRHVETQRPVQAGVRECDSPSIFFYTLLSNRPSNSLVLSNVCRQSCHRFLLSVVFLQSSRSPILLFALRSFIVTGQHRGLTTKPNQLRIQRLHTRQGLSTTLHDTTTTTLRIQQSTPAWSTVTKPCVAPCPREKGRLCD